MWSQVELVYFQIRDGNEAGADEAFGKLVTLFADQPTLPREIYQVGDEHVKALNYDKAGALYRYVIANWPGGEYEMWARTGIIKLDICLGNDANVQPALDELIADFNDQPALPEAIFVIGEQYYRWASQCRKAGLSAKEKDIIQKAIAVWQRIITDLSSSHITPQAYYMSGRCYERIGKYENAIEYYSIVVDNWPDYEFAWNAQFLIARCFDKLARSGVIPKEDAAPLMLQACENVIINYPDSMAVNAATNLMKRWESVKAR
jgi:TolA-binding protein